MKRTASGRLVAGVAVIGLALAGCGQAATQEAATQPSTSIAPAEGGGATSMAPEPASADEGGQPASEDAAPGAGDVAKESATVTIGDESFEFTDLYCITLGGMVSAESSVSVGDNDLFELNLPPDGGSSADFGIPSVHVVAASSEEDWIAGSQDIDLPDGQSQVDSYTLDGARATGTATFLDSNAWLAGQGTGVAGTFTVNCEK